MAERKKGGVKKILDEYYSLLRLSETFGVIVSNEGEIIKDIINEHPEYAGFLDQGELQIEDGTTINPRLHIIVESIVQNQLGKGEPEDARQAYLALLKENVDPHEARHAIGRIFMEMIWLILNNKLTSDPTKYYRKQLRGLKRKGIKHRVFKQ